MSASMLFYTLFVAWGVVAIVALVKTDLSARRNVSVARSDYEPLTVVGRADGTVREETRRRATG